VVLSAPNTARALGGTRSWSSPSNDRPLTPAPVNGASRWFRPPY
jgi:hypothetical protein